MEHDGPGPSNKRYLSEAVGEEINVARLNRSTRRPELPDELTQQLVSVGMRARKAVSDGYQHPTSIPSYRGMTIGPTQNLGSSSFGYKHVGSTTFPTNNMQEWPDNSIRLEKRTREEYRVMDFDEDEGAGTDIDEDDCGESTTSATSATQRSFTQEPAVLDKQQKRLYIARKSVSHIN